MPQGNPPSNQIELYVVFSDGIGAFGPSLNEISRLGLNELQYVKGANRGEETQVQAQHFVASEQEAIEFEALVTDLQGTEIALKSESTEKEWTVFLLTSRSFYRPCGHTDPLKNYIIRFTLGVQRTK